MPNIYTEYYICFNNAEGSFPQRDSSSKNREEVDLEVKKLNQQLKDEGRYPWCYYSMEERKYYNENGRKIIRPRF